MRVKSDDQVFERIATRKSSFLIMCNYASIEPTDPINDR